MMQVRKWWIASASLFLLASCGTDPFPKNGYLKVEKPKEAPVIPPPFVIDVPEVVSFKEGTEGEFSFQASVPAPGISLVSISGLPEGAKFLENSMKVIWTPSFTAANSESDPGVIVKEYPIRITLRSSFDKITTVSRSVTLLVRDSLRSLTIKAADNFNFKEGKLYRKNFFVESTDFPNGPFEFSANNLPSGAFIEKDSEDPRHFVLVYAPDFSVATISDSYFQLYGHYKAFKDVVFRAIAPRGNTSLPAELRVFDTRQSPRVSAPAKITQVGPVNFTLTAEDLNFETEPEVTLEGEPAFGVPAISVIQDTSTNPSEKKTSGAFNFDWANIPNSKMGATERIKFKACVFKSLPRGQKQLCSRFAVDVTFSGVAHGAPLVDRTSWPVATTQYVRVGETITVPVSIKDAEASEWVGEVNIFPESLRNEVSWKDGELVVATQTVGVKPFTLIAQSKYGVTRVEHFVVDALPASWSPTLLLGDSLSDAELGKTIGLFDRVQVANPVLQTLDTRMTTLRKTLVLTTSTLAKNKSALSQIENVAMNIPQVIVLSPLANTFKGSLATEFSRLGLKFEGRMDALPSPVPALDTFVLKVEGLIKPNEEIRLEGKLTSESKAPAWMSITGNACKTLLSLEKSNPAVSYPVAVLCDRGDDRKILVSGFEWGDAALAPADAKILEKWIKEIFP